MLTGPMMMLVGAVAMFIIWRWWGIRWRILWAGGALWVASVALKIGFAFMTNRAMSRWLHAGLPQGWAGPAFWAYIGLLTGIFECGIFLPTAPLLLRRQWTWHEAVSLGVGFGATEALVVGAQQLLSNLGGPLGTVTTVLVPGLERLLALVIHVAAVVMILQALVARKWPWFWASFGYKSTVDAVAAWLLLSGTRLTSHPWIMEGICVAPFALVGLLVLFKLRQRWMSPVAVRLKCPLGA